MRRMSLAVLLLVLCPLALDAAPGKVTLLTGANNDLIDRPAIQAAVDAAPKNGTVRLQGTFQLDGVEIYVRRGHLTIEGVALDNDGDHRTNEDWADGSDNDNDGAIDEDDYDAVLQGVLDGFGAPDQGSFPPQPGNPGRSLFNRGIAVQGVENVTVRDLKFTGMARGVAFSGDTEVQPGLYCDDITYSIGTAKNGTAERNLFDNMVRGVQAFGAAHNVRFKDNTMVNQGPGVDVLVVGDGVSCWEYDETQRPGGIPIGRPTGTQITGNTISHRNAYVAQVISADSTLLRDNVIEDVFAPLYISNSPKTQVIGNTMASKEFEVVLVQDTAPRTSAGSSFQNNLLFPGLIGVEAIGVYGDVTGLKISNTTLMNTDAVVYFAVDTHDNTVVLKQGQIAYDDGTNNKIIGGGS